MTVRLHPFKHFTDQYLGWLNDPEINQYTSRGAYPITEAEARRYIAECQSPDRIVWAIMVPHPNPVIKDSLAHIGNISLQKIDQFHRSAELAILIGEKMGQHQGYGYNAARQVCNHGFNSLGLKRIYCGMHQDNIAMQKLAEKLGMRKEGQSRQAMFKNGNYADIFHYGMLKEEFENAHCSIIDGG